MKDYLNIETNFSLLRSQIKNLFDITIGTTPASKSNHLFFFEL